MNPKFLKIVFSFFFNRTKIIVPAAGRTSRQTIKYGHVSSVRTYTFFHTIDNFVVGNIPQILFTTKLSTMLFWSGICGNRSYAFKNRSHLKHYRVQVLFYTYPRRHANVFSERELNYSI